MTSIPLDEALRFVAADNSVIPCSMPTKRPSTQGPWGKFQQKAADDETVKRWFTGRGADALGVVMGAVSGGREMLDFDALAEETYGKWAEAVEHRRPGLVTRLAMERTINSGIHLHYRCEVVEGNLKLAIRQHPEDPKKQDVLIETRGEGGYAVVAPTAGYTLVRGDIANPPTITTAERAVMIEEARALNRWVHPDQTVRGNPTRTVPPKGDRQARATQSKGRPGDDYNERATNEDMLKLLEAEGWQIERKLPDGTHRLTRPGKDPRDGISATLGYMAPGVLYVFSSNAPHPFEPGHAYSPFAVLAFTKYGGDFSAASRDLAAEGYGQAPPPPPTPLRPMPTDAPPPQVAEGTDDGEELPDNVIELKALVLHERAQRQRAEGLAALNHQLLCESIARENEMIERHNAERQLWQRKDKTSNEKATIVALTELYYTRKDDPDTAFTGEGAVVIPFSEIEKMVGVSKDAAYRAVSALNDAETKRATEEGRERQFEYAPERKQVETAGGKMKKWTGSTGFKMAGQTYPETIKYMAGIEPVRTDKDGQKYHGESKWGGLRCPGCSGHRFVERRYLELECLDCHKIHRSPVREIEHQSVVTLSSPAVALLKEARHQKRQAASATCGGGDTAPETSPPPPPPQNAEQVNTVPQDAEGIPPKPLVHEEAAEVEEAKDLFAGLKAAQVLERWTAKTFDLGGVGEMYTTQHIRTICPTLIPDLLVSPDPAKRQKAVRLVKYLHQHAPDPIETEVA